MRVLTAAALATTCLVAFPAAAWAQQDQAGGPVQPAATASPTPIAQQPIAGDPAQPTDNASGDIVVTANRQSQSLQRVSSAVQVIDGARLTSQALTNVAQVFANTPSVQVNAQPAGFNIDIRGQGADLPAGSTQGAVALEFDGVYNILSQAATIGFFDVQRIEVLPGPQSTRYGPNADGGVVNVITRDPILGSWDGRASLTVGNYGLVRAEVGQDIPLTDTLALRVAGAAIHRNSYFEPAGANAIAQSLRTKLLFRPSDDLTIKLQYELDHIGGTGSGAEVGTPIYLSKVAEYIGDSINDYGNPWHHGDYADNGNDARKAHANLYQNTLQGTVSYKFADWAAVDATGAIIRNNGTQTACYAPGGTRLIGGNRTCYEIHPFAPFRSDSAELRLHNPDGSRLLWNLGYYHWNYTSSAYSSDLSYYPLGQASAGLSSTVTNAVFGDLTYPVTDRFRVIGGLRESFDKRVLVPDKIDQRFTRSLNHFDYRVGEEFDIAPRVMQYFTVSTGYRPGGLTYAGALNTAIPIASEVNTAFEFGVKSRLFDNLLQLNADAFYYRQSNYQLTDNYAGFPITLADGTTHTCSRGDANPGCTTPNISANAHSLGFETQIRVTPTHRDTLTIGTTWLKAKFNNEQGQTCATIGLPAALQGGCYYGYSPIAGATNAPAVFFELSGATQPHSPHFQTTIAYDHVFELGGGYTLRAGGDAFHSTGYWVHPVQDAEGYGWQPSYWQENLNLTLAAPGDRWSLNAYMRNVSNYAVKLSDLPAATISDPRTFGLTLNAKW